MIDGLEAAKAFADLQSRPAFLFGSWSRGDAAEQSDIDVLLVVDSPAGPSKAGLISVSRYTDVHLQALSRSGSLFVLHLLLESKPLNKSAREVLEALRRDFVKPVNYGPYRLQLGEVLRILDVSPDEYPVHQDGLENLARFIARSFVYSLAADAAPSSMTFALQKAIFIANDTNVRKYFELSQAHDYKSYSARVAVLRLLAGSRASNPFGTIEALLINEPATSMTAVFAKRVLSHGSADPYEPFTTDAPWIQ